MPDVDALLRAETGMGYAPIASGIREPVRYGTEGVPIVDTFGLPSQAVLSGPFRGMMQSAGMAPMGLGHDQNIYDIIRARQFYESQRQAVAMAAQHDRRGYMRTMQNLYGSAGIPFGLEQRRAASSIASLAMAGSPMLTQIAPEFLDALGGQMGSAAVMSSRLMDSGRYMMDPVTGMTGMSAASTARLTGQLYAGVEADRGRFITAGQTGSLVGELERRGLVGGGFLNQDAQLAALRGDSGFGQAGLNAAGRRAGVNAAGKMSGKDLDNLMMDPEVSDRLRSIDATRIQKSIEGYSKAVSVMRDIFGDSGKPNAPMQELLAGLEALTMGMSNQFDPTQLGNIAQKTYTLSKNAGVNMAGLMAIQGNMAANMQRSGLDPSFAVLGTQQSLAANQAIRQLAMGQGGGWNGMDTNQMTQLYGNLFTGAAGSDVANRLGFLNRMGQEVGFSKNTAAAAAFQALKEGQKTFVDPTTGQTRTLASLSGSQLVSMTATATGTSEASAERMLQERTVNNEFKTPNVINTTMSSQLSDVSRQLFSPVGAATLQGALAGKMDPKAAALLAGKANEAILSQLTNTRFDDIKNFKADLGGIIQDALRNNGGAAMLDSMAPEQRQQFLNSLTTGFIGAQDSAIKNSQYSGLKGFFNSRRMLGPELTGRVGSITTQAETDAAMSSSLQGLGRGTLLRRGFDALRDVDLSKPGGVREALAKTVGGVSAKDISESVAGQLQELATLQREAEGVQRQINNASPADLPALRTKYGALTAQLKDKSDAVATVVGQTGGIFSFGAIAPGTLGDAARTQQVLHSMTLDTMDVTSGVSAHVSDKDAEAAALRYGAGRAKMTDAELTKMVATQKRVTLENKTYSEPELAPWRKKFGMETSASGEVAAVARKYELEALDNLKLSPEALDYYRNSTDPLEGLKGGGKGVMALFGREYAKFERSQKPLGVDESAVSAYARDNQMTPEQARFQLEALNRADRWGIDRKSIIRQSGETDADAVMRLYTDMQATLLGNKEGRIKAYVEGQGSAKRFWRSEDAQRLRDAVEAGSDQMNDFVNAVAHDPSVVRSMGTDALRTARRFKEIRKEKQRLADIYTGGDLARLQIGDFDYNPANEEEYKAVMAAKASLHKMDADVATGFGVMNARVRGGVQTPEQEARSLLGFNQAPMTQDQANQTRKMTENITAYRRMKENNQLPKAGQMRNIRGQLDEAAKKAGMSSDELIQLLTTEGGLGKDTRTGAIKDQWANLQSLALSYKQGSADLGANWVGGMEYDDRLQKERQEIGGGDPKNDFAELLGYHGISEAKASSNPALMQRLKGQRDRLATWKDSAKRIVTRATAGGIGATTDPIGQMQTELETAEKDNKLAGFRTKYGIEDEKKYQEFREDMALQKKLRGSRLQGTESQRMAALSEGIERQTAPQMNITATLPDNMKLEMGGEVKLIREGTALGIDASTAGQINNTTARK